MLEQLLAAAALAGGGQWRVPGDAAERSYDQLVDRILDGNPPDNFRAWTWRVLMNHLKSGPTRRMEDRSRTQDLDAEPVPAEALRWSKEGIEQRRARLSTMNADIEKVLSDLERVALQALLVAPDIACAAAACGMSERDLRTRRSRIIRKLRGCDEGR